MPFPDVWGASQRLGAHNVNQSDKIFIIRNIHNTAGGIEKI